nr:CHASE3 domain-containing protein [Candidatus Dormibacteraeota bacterium]
MPFRHRDQRPRRLDQSVTGVLARLAALAIVSLGLLVGTSAWRTVIFEQTTKYIDASQSLQLATSGMLDEETGLRGYLAAHDAVLLQPYTAGEAELSRGNASLQQLLGSEPAAFTPFLNLRLAEQTWLTQWAGPALQAGEPPGQLDAFLQQGKTLFDAYRGTGADVQLLLETRINQLEADSSAISNGALAFEGLLVVVGALLWWRSRRQLRTWIVAPVTGILGTLRRFESGDYAAPEVPEHGPAELRSIGLRLTSLGNVLESTRATGLVTSREAADHAERLRMVVDLSRELTGSLNLHYVLGAVAASVLRLGICTRCVIWLTDDAAHTLVPMFDSAGVKGRIEG